LGKRPPNGRVDHLVSLRRLHAVVSAKHSTVNAIKATIDEELRNLVDETLAESRGFQNDFFSSLAFFIQWAAQKIPELSQMDRSDFVLGKTAWFVRKHNPIQVKKFFSFKQLSPIHPHTRVTSDEKQDARAIDARQARPLFEKHGMRMSEAMTDTDPALSSFQSTTRIQVVEMGAGQYVTIEGNGRIEALKRAFKDMPPEFDLRVEVRLQVFEDEKTVNAVRKHVRDCRIAKGLEDGA
jgi:hypothetical protein